MNVGDASTPAPSLRAPSAAPAVAAPLRLPRLVALRWFEIAAEIGLVVLAGRWLGLDAPLEPVLAVCAAQAGLNLALIAFGRGRDASDGQLLAQLLLDVAALSLIVYFAGGAANPLISLYLPLVAVSAAVLPARLASVVAVASVACYSLLNVLHSPVHIHDHELALEAHLAGMWLIFVLSAGTIAWFVVRLTSEVRRRDAALASAREAALRNERVVALGNLAAGAAHELGSPLATMAVLAGEIAADPALPARLREDAELLRSQVASCKEIITGLAVQAGGSRAEHAQLAPLDAWVCGTIARWRALRPRVQAAVDVDGTRPAPRIVADATLGQALVNLFQNAADASPAEVAIHARWTDRELLVEVLDRGAGIPGALGQALGREQVRSQEGGMGIGVMLAFAAVERSGGSVEFSAREGGGTMARVRLPLAGLMAGEARSP
jgi:two-component system sensor histidine kinase RegB